VRQSAKTRSWKKAEEAARRVEARFRRALDGDTTALQEAKTIGEAVKLFLEDKKEQQSGDALIGKLTRLLESRAKPKVENPEKAKPAKQKIKVDAPPPVKVLTFVQWCSEQSVTRIADITLSHLEDFRKTWPGNALTKQKTQELLRSFFNYCVRHGWVRKNPAALLSKIRVDSVPTDYFTSDEFEKIITACETYNPTSTQLGHRREKVKALTLLMRWSGLRAGDAIKLERIQLTGNKLLLRTEKTGTPVWCPIPPDVADLLRKIENSNPRFFFWSGNGSADSAYSDWHRTFESVFAEANLGKRCHLHMFRDTFAIELLLAGVPIEQVSVLLGHKSIRITEKHYSPWVSARQEQLEASVKKSWKAQGKEVGARAKTQKAGK
jgi:integrase